MSPRAGNGLPSAVARRQITPCKACPLRANPAFRDFKGAERSFIENFKTGELAVQAGTSILIDGHDSPHLYTILEGWAVRIKHLENGARQVLNFGMPGDFIGLQSTLFDKMQHSVEALSDMALCVFERDRLWELFERHAGLAFDITWLAAREESILADHLVNVGQQPAFERLAYIIHFLFERARRCGLASGNTVKMPITQEHLADAMGLSIVHTNKTLKKLKATGAIDWSRGELRVVDGAKLAELSGYETMDGYRRPFI